MSINGVERAIRLAADVCRGICHTARDEWRLCGALSTRDWLLVLVLPMVPGLLIWVSLFNQEEANEKCNKHESSAYDIWKKVRETGEETVVRKHGRKVLTWIREASSNRRPWVPYVSLCHRWPFRHDGEGLIALKHTDDCTDAPYEWHHCVCASC